MSTISIINEIIRKTQTLEGEVTLITIKYIKHYSFNTKMLFQCQEWLEKEIRLHLPEETAPLEADPGGRVDQNLGDLRDGFNSLGAHGSVFGWGF